MSAPTLFLCACVARVAVDAGLHIMAPGTAARGKHGGDDNGAM